jgi:hypothetical protein
MAGAAATARPTARARGWWACASESRCTAES